MPVALFLPSFLPRCRNKESLFLHVALALIKSKQGEQRKEVPLPGLVGCACLTRCHSMLFWRGGWGGETSKRTKLKKKKKYQEAADLSF